MRATLALLCAAAVAAEAPSRINRPVLRRHEQRAGAELPRSALLRSRVLRGGDAEASEAETVGRLRLTIAEGDTKDYSIAELSPTVLAQMGLEAGDHVQIRGRKQRKVVCIAMPDEALAEGEVRLSASARANTGLAKDEAGIVSSVTMEDATRVLLLPFASTIGSYDGDIFDDALKPFLADNDRPLSVGELVETPCGEGEDAHKITWKVMELDFEVVEGEEAEEKVSRACAAEHAVRGASVREGAWEGAHTRRARGDAGTRGSMGATLVGCRTARLASRSPKRKRHPGATLRTPAPPSRPHI